MSTTTTAEEEKSDTKTCKSYDELVKELDTVSHLSRASAVLNYDEMVFMPHTELASAARGAQKAALAAVIHEKSTDPKLGQLLDAAEAEMKATDAMDDEKSRVLELERKKYERKIRIPTELESKRAMLSAESYNRWVKARTTNDFGLFRDILKQCIDVSIETATAQRGDETDKSIYETMLDEYETEMTTTRIDSIFAEIKDALVPLINRILGPDATPPSKEALKGHFAVDKQEAFCKDIVQAIGFDDTNGRIDVAVHPFTSGLGGPADVRITSRFQEDSWYQGLLGSVHEGGHAIYEQNLGGSTLSIDSALSMGMHESQSLFWERHVGRSRSFWKFAAPKLNEKFGTSHTAEDLYGAVNFAARSLIRVDADELTYPLHIILRYGMEREFIEGKLSVDDIPARWNADMKELLGIDVPSDDKGCLQDIHWSMLAFGYFPTYLIGAATAAQLTHYCKMDIPDFDDNIEAGDFKEIKNWLTEKVHKHGSRYKSLDDHLMSQFGEPLNPKYYIEYLTEKYTDLYKC